MTRDLTGLFSPSSIAIIGASQSPQKVGSIALKNIISSGFRGRVYPVNPNVTNFSQLQFYPTILDLPEVPDLAIFAIPAAVVADELLRCAKAGIKNFVIYSAGFKEIGPAGQLLENNLIDIATQYQLNILGPNCLGFASPRSSLNATFGSVIKNPGNLRLISQSGALAASLFDWCQTTGLGFSDFVTIGNKAILGENEILESWLPALKTSPPTPIGLYLESITDGRKLVEILSQISPNHPVFVLKPGKSPLAATAMRSHTGAIAGEDHVLDAALHQVGAIRCPELGDFFDLATTFSWVNVPLGPHVAVISNAGGPAVLTTDTISSHGLELAKFSDETEQKLATCLPRIASIINPVDVLGDALADRFGQALEIVLQEKATQSVVVILTPQLMTQITKTAEIIGELSKKYPQPIICSFIGGGHTTEGRKILNSYHIPSFSFPERAVAAIAAMWQWQNWRQSLPSATTDTPPALAISSIENQSVEQLLSTLSIPTPPSKIISSLKEASDFVEKYAYPVVLKLNSPNLLHKSDIGGVITNIDNNSKLSTAFQALGEKHVDIQIQKQITGGIEVIVGCKRDPTFGPVMLFGAGGKYAEILQDRNLHLLPLTLATAQKLVTQSKVFRLLSGFRDDPPYDLTQLYQIMLTLGQLFTTFSSISEIEINPVIVTHTDTFAVDPKIILS